MVEVKNSLIDSSTDVETISDNYELLTDSNSFFSSKTPIGFIYKVATENSINIKYFNENIYKKDYELDIHLKKMMRMGVKIEFYKLESEILFKNLLLIDSDLPVIISNLLLQRYFKKEPNLYKLIELLKKYNPLGYPTDSPHSFYDYKIKKMLRDMALGMSSDSIWKGKETVSELKLVTKDDGKVINYHVYDMQNLITFLLKNTYLDNPTDSRGKFGKIYQEKGQMYIKLNFQIK